MKRKCQPKKAGPLTAAICLGALSVAIFASLAQTIVKTESEPWIAPARAARKQNPIPADGKSIAQGKEFFTAGCLPCHGPAGKGDGPAAVGLERNGAPVRPGNLSSSKRATSKKASLSNQSGATLWAQNCGHCHNLRSPDSLSDAQWDVVVLHMRVRANLTAEEHREILAFLKSAH